jgi:outer membrane lipoprotein carrier protein
MEQLVVTDGRRLWMYDVELAQVTVAPLDDAAGASPAMLLSGDEAVREGFDVIQEFAWDGLEWVSLEPRLRGAEFTLVLVGFRGERLERLELVDCLDQVTRIEFANEEINPELDEDLFEFEPPAGVDVLGADD